MQEVPKNSFRCQGLVWLGSQLFREEAPKVRQDIFLCEGPEAPVGAESQRIFETLN